MGPYLYVGGGHHLQPLHITQDGHLINGEGQDIGTVYGGYLCIAMPTLLMYNHDNNLTFPILVPFLGCPCCILDVHGII